MAKEPENSKKDQVDAPAFNQVAAHARIAGIRLMSSRFDMKPEALDGYDEAWKLRQKHELVDWLCDNDENVLRGSFDFEASSLRDRKKLISLKGRYLCTYRLSDICDADAGMHFLERVGRFAAYPYFRSLFATVTQQAGLMIPPLPVIQEQPRWVQRPQTKVGKT